MGGFGEVEKRIGYKFDEPALLRRALIHPSADTVSKEDKDQSKRLCWLGDSVLNLIVADKVFELFPNSTKRELHNMRDRLTNNITLARVATRLGLDSFLLKGTSLERNPVAKDRHEMLATAVEALIGAVYLDGEIQKARAMIRYAFEDEFRAVLEA